MLYLDRELFEGKSRELADKMVSSAREGLENGTLRIPHISAVLNDPGIEDVIEEVMRESVFPRLSGDSSDPAVIASLNVEARRAKAGMRMVLEFYSDSSINPQKLS